MSFLDIINSLFPDNLTKAIKAKQLREGFQLVDEKFDTIINNVAQNIKGSLTTADAKPTVDGKYELVGVGTFANLIPNIKPGETTATNTPITTKSGYLNTVYFDGTNFIFNEVEIAIDAVKKSEINQTVLGASLLGGDYLLKYELKEIDFSISGFIAKSGIFSSNASWMGTDYILVKKNQKIKVRLNGRNGVPTVAFFNVNKVFQTALGSFTESASVAEIIEAEYIIPNDGYIIAQNRITELSSGYFAQIKEIVKVAKSGNSDKTIEDVDLEIQETKSNIDRLKIANDLTFPNQSFYHIDTGVLTNNANVRSTEKIDLKKGDSVEYQLSSTDNAISSVALLTLFTFDGVWVSSLIKAKEHLNVGVTGIYTATEDCQIVVSYVNYTNFVANKASKIGVIEVENLATKQDVENISIPDAGRQILNPNLPKKTIGEELKVLFIGSSWLEDTCWNVRDVALNLGVNVLVGNIYKGGFYYSQQLEYWNNNTKPERYTEFPSAGGGTTEQTTEFPAKTDFGTTLNLKQIVQRHAWDVIVFQQGAAKSFLSYNEEFQPYMRKFIQKVKSMSTNPNVYCAMSHGFTPAQNGVASLMTGTNLTTATKKELMDLSFKNIKRASYESGINMILPCGASLWTARTSPLIEDSNNTKDLTRDDIHLDLGVGRTLTAMTVFESLIAPIYGISIKDSTYTTPETWTAQVNRLTPVTNDNREIIIKCAVSAANNRFDYTNYSDLD